jgi:aryl-alcohol dehydrogenase-like predicted oxidoreductase
VQTRPLRSTDIDITPIGFGAWAIGERYAPSPGAVAVAWKQRRSRW